MSLKLTALGVMLLTIVSAGAAIAVANVQETPSADFTIIQDGEGYTDPLPGVHTVEIGREITISMIAAEGWLLSMVTVDNVITPIVDGTITLTIDHDTTIHVYFVTYEVVLPSSSEYVFDGSLIEAYADTAGYTVIGGSAKDVGEYTATFSLRHPEYCHWSDGTIADKTVTWSIAPKQVSADDFEPIAKQIYDGGELTPVLRTVLPFTVDDIESVDYRDNVHVGTAYIDVVAKGNYVGEVTLSFIIDAVDISDATVHLLDSRFVYDGTEKVQEVLSVFIGGLTATYDVTGDRATDAGTYTLTVTGTGDFTGTASAQWSIAAKDIANAVITLDDSNLVYNGNAQTKQVVSVTIDGLTATYTVQGNIETDAGIHTLVITGTGNFTGTASKVWSIAAKQVMVSVDSSSKVYGEADPEFTATVEGLVGDDQVEYEFVRGDQEDVGSHAVAVVGDRFQGNYEVSYAGSTLTITKRAVSFSSPDASKLYDGDALVDDDITIGGLGLAFDDRVAFTVTGTQTTIGNSSNAFTYAFTVGDEDNYDVAVHYGTLTVYSDEITVIANSASRTYNGSALTDSGYTYTGDLADGDALVVTITGTITDAGTVPNVVSSVKVMRGSVDVTSLYNMGEHVDGVLEVTKVSVTIKSGSGTWTYDGQVHSVHQYALVGSFIGNDGVDLTYTKTIKDVGTVDNEFTYELTGNPGNYDVVTEFGQLTVNRAIVTVEADDKSKVYGEADPEFTSTHIGIVDDFVVTHTHSREAGEDVGEYDIIPAGDRYQGNYEVQYVTGTLTVTRATATVTADNITITYGDEAPTLTATVTGTVGDDTLTYTISRVQGSDVGSYTITPAGAAIQGNYNVVYVTGTLVIEHKAVTVKAEDKSKVYGSADPSLTATVAGTLGTDQLDYIISRVAGDNVGTYTITAAGEAIQGNYKVTYVTGTFTITKAMMTVTADDKSKVYGDADPAFTAVITGLVNNDAASAFGYTCTRVAGEDAGTYKISVVLNEVPRNYDVTYVTGTLTITKADLEVKADYASKVYGSDDPELTATFIGLKNGDTKAIIDYTVTRAVGEDAGTYDITVTGDQTHKNYNITYVGNDFVINRATATVDAEDKSKVYGSDDPELTAIVDGLKRGDDESLIVYTLSRVAGEDVGSYLITPSGNVEQGNYNVMFVTATLTITGATVTVTADDKSKVYGSDDPAFTATVDGLKRGDDRSVISYTFSRVAGENVGSYIITPAGQAVQGNYNVVFSAGELTITRAVVTVTADDKSKVYGSDDPELTTTVTGLKFNDTRSLITYTVARATGDDVGTYTITPSGNVEQGNYEVQYVTGTLTISKRSVVFTSSDATKVYDGNALTKDEVTIGGVGLADGDNVEFDVTGTQTVIGSSPNTFTYTFTVGDEDNYGVTVEYGTLTVTSNVIVVTADSSSREYDGTALTDDGYTYVGNISAGDRLEVAITGSITVVGSVDNIVSSVKVMRGDVDVTSSYTMGTHVNGTLTVTKANITITSASGTWTYDGTEHDADSYTTNRAFATGDGVALTYTKTIKDAGSVRNEFTYVLTGNPEYYNITTEYGILTVNPKSIVGSDVTLGADLIYNGQLQTKEVVSVVIDGLYATFDVTGNTGTDAKDDYVLKVSGKDNFIGSVDVIWKIEPRDVEEATVTVDNVTLVYNGQSQSKDIQSVVINVAVNPMLRSTAQLILVEGTDYVVAGDSAVNAGEHKIILTGKGNYDGDKEVTWTIMPKELTVTSESLSKDYDGSAFADSEYKVYTQVGLVDGDTITCSFTDQSGFKTAGSVKNKFTISFDDANDVGNYNVTQTEGTLTIAKRSIAGATITLQSNSFTYDGGKHTVTIDSVKLVVSNNLTLTLVVGTDYEIVSGDSATNAGTYSLTIKGKGNYADDNAYVSWEIAKRSIADASIVLVDGGFIYDRTEKTQQILSVKAGNLTVTYDVSGNKGINAGTYTLTVTGTGNFTGTKSVNWSIAAKDIANAVVELGGDLVYNGVEQTKEITSVKVDGLTVTYTVTGDTGTNAGTYTMTVTGNVNFTGSVTADWTIGKKALTIASVSLSKVYDGTPFINSDYAVVEVDGLVTRDGFTTQFTDQSGFKTVGSVTNSFTYSFDAGTIAGNYDVTKTEGTLTITQRDISKDISQAAITLVSDSFVYDGNLRTVEIVSVTIVVGGSTIVLGTTDYSVSGDSATDAGTYTLTVTGTGNFTGTKSVDWSIAPHQLVADDFVPINPQVYIGGQITPDVQFISELSGILSITEDCTVTYGTNKVIGVDSGTVTIVGKANATGTVELKFDIYTGLTVYVTQDGFGNTYADRTVKLSSFGTSTNPLYNMSGISAGTSETAKMVVVNDSTYSGIKLGIVVKELTGDGIVGGVLDGTNKLPEYLVLTVKRGSEVYTTTIIGAYTDILVLGDLDTTGDIPIEVTLSLPSSTPADGVQDKSIKFSLAIGVIYPEDTQP